jgi:hypothetical protein
MRVFIVRLDHLHDLRDRVRRFQTFRADPHLDRVAHELRREAWAELKGVSGGVERRHRVGR